MYMFYFLMKRSSFVAYTQKTNKQNCRELRQSGGTPSALYHGSRALYDAEPGSTAKRQRTSHSIPPQPAGFQSPVMPSHSVPSAKWGPLSARGKKPKTVCSEYIHNVSCFLRTILGQFLDLYSPCHWRCHLRIQLH